MTSFLRLLLAPAIATTPDDPEHNVSFAITGAMAVAALYTVASVACGGL